MKKNLLLFLLLFLSACLYAQTKDTTPKKDTVVVVKAEKTDTIPVHTFIYFGENNVLKYDTTGGFVVIKGIATQIGKNTQWVWSDTPGEQPVPVAYLRKNKTLLKYKIWTVN